MLNIKFGLVRVEDVSLAHLRAVTTPEAKEKRFILCGQSEQNLDEGNSSEDG